MSAIHFTQLEWPYLSYIMIPYLYNSSLLKDFKAYDTTGFAYVLPPEYLSNIRSVPESCNLDAFSKVPSDLT